MRCKMYRVTAEWKSRRNPGVKYWIVAKSKKQAEEFFKDLHKNYYDITTVTEYNLYEGMMYHAL